MTTVKATIIAVTVGLYLLLFLGGLYLYMNRFEYLRLGHDGSGSGVYLRINKLTGHECAVWKGADYTDVLSGIEKVCPEPPE